MCTYYSFIMTRDGKIYDGGGLTQSHSSIARMHKIDGMDYNQYEYLVPTGAVYDLEKHTETDILKWLHLDHINFEVSNGRETTIRKHLSQKFPTSKVYDSQRYSPLVDRELDGKVVDVDGEDTAVFVSDDYKHTYVHVKDQDNVKCFVFAGKASGSMSGGYYRVYAHEHAQISACGGGHVFASGKCNVNACDHVRVNLRDDASGMLGDYVFGEACGRARVECSHHSMVTAGGDTQVYAMDHAVVDAWGNARIRARHDAVVSCSGEGERVHASHSVIVRLFGDPEQRPERSIKLCDKAVAIHECEGKIYTSDQYNKFETTGRVGDGYDVEIDVTPNPMTDEQGE